MAKNAFIKTRYEDGFDYDMCAKVFSLASGSDVTWDRVGDDIYFITDGNPGKVMNAILREIEDAIIDLAAEAIEQSILFNIIGASGQERNARLN